MDAKVKCLSDDDKGFTKGEMYPVLNFGESVALLRNDAGSIVGVSYAQINSELWELQPLEGDAKSKPAPEPEPEPEAKAKPALNNEAPFAEQPAYQPAADAKI